MKLMMDQMWLFREQSFIYESNDGPDVTFFVNEVSMYFNPISLKWGLLRPRRDESVDHFQIGCA